MDRNWQAEIEQLQLLEAKSRALLGVSELAKRSEIVRAFRTASFEHHPDRRPEDPDAAKTFHLICCAYKFLLSGEVCEALEKLQQPEDAKLHSEFCDNPWGYWCWWRNQYF
jgi:hypothetical protein